MRVLLIAPVCDGDDVGEARAAFQWASRLSLSNDVTLLTYHKRGRRPTSTQLTGLRVIEWKEPPFVGRAERLNSMLAPGYIPFYARARRWIKAALANGETFEVAFQPVPVAMRYPCPASGLGIPVILGPVGGGIDSPAAFQAEEGTDPWYVRLRKFDALRLRYDPMLRRTYEDAACVLGIAPYVRGKLATLALKRFEVMSETALTCAPTLPRRVDGSGPVVALFVGRLVRTKGLRDTIRAMSLCDDLSVRLDVVGDGPDRAACEALTRALHLDDRVTFHGRLPRPDVECFYRSADIFVFPSYREPGGNVVLEAMGHALPVIVCDSGGPGAATDDRCAFRLKATTPTALACDVAQALRSLITDSHLRRAMGKAAFDHVTRHGLWHSRVERMETLFREVVAESGRLPVVARAAPQAARN
jgi:glycosyltransferase involved in cell wall biosynthesis